MVMEESRIIQICVLFEGEVYVISLVISFGKCISPGMLGGSYLYSGLMGLIGWGGGGGVAKGLCVGILTHISMWSEFGPWFNGRYPPEEMLIAAVPHILYIASLFLVSPCGV